MIDASEGNLCSGKGNERHKDKASQVSYAVMRNVRGRMRLKWTESSNKSEYSPHDGKGNESERNCEVMSHAKKGQREKTAQKDMTSRKRSSVVFRGRRKRILWVREGKLSSNKARGRGRGKEHERRVED